MALAVAVTPIMKFDVALATRNGRFMNPLSAGTSNIPPPIPSRPETTPASALKASPIRVTGHLIGDPLGSLGVIEMAVQAKAVGQRIGTRGGVGVPAAVHEHQRRGGQDHRDEREDQELGLVGEQEDGDERAGESAHDRGDLQEHADPDVGEPLAHVGGGRSARGGDHGDEARGDRDRGRHRKRRMSTGTTKRPPPRPSSPPSRPAMKAKPTRKRRTPISASVGSSPRMANTVGPARPPPGGT